MVSVHLEYFQIQNGWLLHSDVRNVPELRLEIFEVTVFERDVGMARLLSCIWLAVNCNDCVLKLQVDV